MRATLTVFRHEWAGFVRNRVALSMILIVGVIGSSVAVIERAAWKAEQSEREKIQAQEVEQWLALDNTHIHKAAHRGYFVVRDLPPGVILDRGVWDFGGSAIWLEAHRRNAPQLRAVDSAALVVRGAPRGVGPVLLWLIPLLCVVLLHSIVAGERASGSLAFAVSSGAPAAAITFGKTLAAVSLTWIAAAVPMVFGIWFAIDGGLAVVSAVTWVVNILTALGVFAGIVVIVSSLASRPLGALVGLLLIWFIMVVLWPRLTPSIVQLAAPIPSSQTVRSEAEIAAEGLVSEATENAVTQQLADAGVRNPNRSGVSAMAAEIDAAAAFAPIFAPLEDGMLQQAKLLDLASWMSPINAADRSVDVSLGVSDFDQFAFEARAEKMRFETQMVLNEGWARANQTGDGNPTLWRDVVAAAQAIPIQHTGSGYAAWGLLIWMLVLVGGLLCAANAVRRSIS